MAGNPMKEIGIFDNFVKKRESILKINIKTLGTGIVFTALLYQDALAHNINGIFGYLDEIEAVTALLILIIYCTYKACVIPNRCRIILGSHMAFLICGIVGNMKSNFQTIGYILLDMLTCSKMVINLILFLVLFRTGKAEKSIERTVYNISKISIFMLFALVVHEYAFTPFFPYLVDRYNIHSLRLFFSNQTYLAETAIYLLLIITITGKTDNRNLLFKVMAICTVASTMRTKAFGFLAVYIMLQFIPLVRNKRKIFFFMFLAGILCVLVGHEYIYYYFFGVSSELSPRKILLLDSVEIAKKYFPIGSGLGTFCSGAANLSYSQIYMENHYANGEYPFNDIFWACIFGQFGFLGCFCFLFYVYQVIVCIIKCRGALKQSYYGVLLYMVYMLIATLGECSFFAPYSNLFGITIGYFVATRRYEEKNKMIERVIYYGSTGGG